ncbi:hypothetical protein B0J14DRAFT_595118 [Halenospora varia]|nr:hypothetical protein B0J14DRAFT_595118 [Halenospora varia]
MRLTQIFILTTSLLSVIVISGSLPTIPSIRATSYHGILDRQAAPSSILATQRATATSISSSTISTPTPIPTLQISTNATTNSSSTAESELAPAKIKFKPAQIAGIVLGVLGGIGSFLFGCLACCDGCGSCCDCSCCSGYYDCDCCSGCCDCDCTCWICDCYVCKGGICGGQSFKEWCCSCRGIMVWSQVICDCIVDWGRCCCRCEGNGSTNRNRDREDRRKKRRENGEGNRNLELGLESGGEVLDGDRKEKAVDGTEEQRLRGEDEEADRRMKDVFGPDAIYRQGDGVIGYQKTTQPTTGKEVEIVATKEVASQPGEVKCITPWANDDVIKEIIGVQPAKASSTIGTKDEASSVAKASPVRMSFKDHEARQRFSIEDVMIDLQIARSIIRPDFETSEILPREY